MATKKISELEAISEAASDDVLAIVDVSETETRKITKGNLLVGAGHTIEMSLNSTTYTLTLSLKNEAGTALSTATIDLPSEDAITGITYSDGALTLTKQSGVTSSVSISGLISGLVDETTFNNFVTSIKATIGISINTYNSLSTYNTGDIVVQNEKIYKCKQDNVTGTFDSTKWDEISLYEYQKLQDQKIENKVEKENGKGLSTNDYTTAEKNKLSGIETGAEVNIIETVKVNGTALTPTDKEVNVPVPTKTSDLNNDSNFGTYSKPSGGIPKTDLASDVQTSLGKADSALQEHQDISGKVDKEHKTGSQVEYKVLSDNNYTDAEKEKLASLENYDDTEITERVDDIEEEQETQNEDIEKLQDKVANQQKILSQMPKVSGEGTEFTMENTIEAQFAEFLPGGNTVQDGEPTVDNPVERYSAGANGSITEKIVNRNWFDKNNATTFKAYINTSNKKIETNNNAKCLVIPCKKNTTYTVSRIAGQRFVVGVADSYSIGTVCSEIVYNFTATNLTITNTDNKYLIVYYYISTADTLTEQEILDSIQIEFGSTATPYTEHKEQTYTIPVQQEMRSVGSVRDRFVKINGIWYERHNIAHIASYNGETITTEYGSTTGELSTGASVDYVLVTPNDLPCTQEQIDVLENLPETYAEQTNVLSEDNVPAYVKASGLLDLNTLLNAIVALGGVI